MTARVRTTTTRRKSILDPANSRWDREVTLDLKEGAETHTRYNRDGIRRLRLSNRLLEQLLDRAVREDLPAMSTWLVTEWSVVGEISTAGGPSPQGCRAAFMAWVDALGADWREHRHAGQTELRGGVKVPAPGSRHLEVSVGLVAKWWDDVDEELDVLREHRRTR